MRCRNFYFPAFNFCLFCEVLMQKICLTWNWGIWDLDMQNPEKIVFLKIFIVKRASEATTSYVTCLGTPLETAEIS